MLVLHGSLQQLDWTPSLWFKQSGSGELRVHVLGMNIVKGN